MTSSPAQQAFPRRLQIAAKLTSLFPVPTPKAKVLRRVTGVGGTLMGAGLAAIGVGHAIGDGNVTSIADYAELAVQVPTWLSLKAYKRELRRAHRQDMRELERAVPLSQ